jgi:uncharacterized protein
LFGGGRQVGCPRRRRHLWRDLVGGAGRRVWQDSRDTVSSKIYGPHLEELARQWCRWHARPETLGDRPSVVQPATLACAQRRRHELDVVVSRNRPGTSNAVLAIGEVKCTATPVGDVALSRLEHLRTLLPDNRAKSPPRLLLFSRTGFTAELLHTTSRRTDVELVDLDRLYRGA